MTTGFLQSFETIYGTATFWMVQQITMNFSYLGAPASWQILLGGFATEADADADMFYAMGNYTITLDSTQIAALMTDISSNLGAIVQTDPNFASSTYVP